METDDVHGDDANGRLLPVRSTEASPTITTVKTAPGRHLFSESDNPDGWIATDLTVELER